MLRKVRSLILHPAIACGNGAIVLLCAAIPRRSSAVRLADFRLSSLNVARGGSTPDGRLIAGTVEQIAVEPSIGSRAGPIACGRNSSLKKSGWRFGM